MLLSAGLPLPTDILVHDYLTVDGSKISKSSGTAVDPAALVADVGTDAVRWWLLRDVPRVGDADFTLNRLVARANSDLAGGLGNLIKRVVTMIHRYRDGRVPTSRSVPTGVKQLADACDKAPDQIDVALTEFDFRRAAATVWTIVEEANRCIETARPWELAKAERGVNGTAAEELDDVLAALLRACLLLADRLTPFLPDAAARITQQCTVIDGTLPAANQLFPRIGR